MSINKKNLKLLPLMIAKDEAINHADYTELSFQQSIFCEPSNDTPKEQLRILKPQSMFKMPKL